MSPQVSVRLMILTCSLIFVGCTSGSQSEPSEIGTDDPVTTSSSAETSADTTAPIDSEATIDLEPLIDGVDVIVATTPAIVSSLRPSLVWEPVEGASRYELVVLDEAGKPYWYWSGTDSQVKLGGGDFSDFGLGPIIGVGYSWSVAAFGSDENLLAISGQIPISVG